MPNGNFPFAVRLIGFSGTEMSAFDAHFAAGHGKGYGYTRLTEGNLQDPDLYIANADQLKALVTLTDLRPSDIRPALLVGTPMVELPYPHVARPVQWPRLFDALDRLVEKRADALSRLEASDVVVVPERRRRDRFDVDLTDPAEYMKMRATTPRSGLVLVVDRTPAFRDHLGELMGRHSVPVAWAATEAKAFELCQQQSTAMVLINTSTPGVDPYRLCRAVRAQGAAVQPAVIFLVGRPFAYDVQEARNAGADGFMNKPLSTHHLTSVMKKFLPLSR